MGLHFVRSTSPTAQRCDMHDYHVVRAVHSVVIYTNDSPQLTL